MERKNKTARRAAAFLLAWALLIPCLRPQVAVSAASGGGFALLADESVATGVRYTEEDLTNYANLPGRRIRFNHLEVNPSADGLRIVSAKAGDTVNAMATINDQAAREIAKGNQVVAGINADSYDMDYGCNRGILIQDGCIVTSQPYQSYTTQQPAFFADRQKKARIGPLRVGGEIRVGSAYRAETDFVNRNHFSGPAGYGSPADSNRLYTASLTEDRRMVNGTGTPPADQAYALIRLENYDGKIHIGQTYRGRVVRVDSAAGFAIPDDCVVYSGYGAKAAAVRALSAGMDAEFTYHLYTGSYTQNPDGTLKDRGVQADAVVTAVNSFQLLVKDGALNHAVVDSVGTDLRARTVIGITKSGTIHFLTAAEPGPNFTESQGSTMLEIAEYMRTNLKCEDVLNMDGGGSTEMLVRHPGEGWLTTAGYPSRGEPRKVSNSLLLVSDNSLPVSRSYASDTTADLTVGASYTFRITSGSRPSFVVGTPGVFDVQFAGQRDQSYFYRVVPTGTAGQQAGVYVNGGPRLLVLTVGKGAAAVASDTTAPFTVRRGGEYQFRLTAKSKPRFTAGSPGFSVSFVRREGSRWYFKVRAVGRSGQACGFYINQSKTPVAVARIV